MTFTSLQGGVCFADCDPSPPQSSGAGNFISLGHCCALRSWSRAWHTAGAQHLLSGRMNDLCPCSPRLLLWFSRMRPQGCGAGGCVALSPFRGELDGRGHHQLGTSWAGRAKGLCDVADVMCLGIKWRCLQTSPSVSGTKSQESVCREEPGDPCRAWLVPHSAGPPFAFVPGIVTN